MTQFFFLLNAALSAVLLVDGLWRRGGYLEVPFLSALIFAIWFLPQAYVLLDDPTLPEGSIARVLTMSLLCLVVILAGWRRGIGRPARTWQRDEVTLDRLILPTVLITLFASAMRAAILAQPVEARAMGQWTGQLTILFFFGQVGAVSLALSFILAFRRGSIVTMVLLGANIFLYAAPLLITFRRGETFEFLFTAMLGLFFLKGRMIPRVVVVAGLIIGFAFVNGVGHLRALSGGYTLTESGHIETRIPTLQEVMQIDWFNFDRFREAKYISETRNAAVQMAATADSGAFGFGAGLWNRLVHAYVPGQIVGHDLKASFFVGEDPSLLALRLRGYEAHTGTTATGFTVLFYDAWFFGAVIFYFTSRIMGQLFAGARIGSIHALLLYAVMLPLTIHALTHFGYYVLVQAPLPLFAAWLAIRYARPTSRKRVVAHGYPRMIGTRRHATWPESITRPQR